MLDRVPQTISDAGRLYLRLHLARDIGPMCARRLVDHFGSIEAVFDASTSALERVEGVGRRRAESIRAARQDEATAPEIERAERLGIRIACWADDDYPKLLNHISDPPICLYVRGCLEPADAVAIAIVGSRRCSRYGLEQAQRFGSLLATTGFTVVSGMARGADEAAHRGALSAEGRTVAVLGCGLGHVYPPESVQLADEIAGQGALVSSLPIDTQPDGSNFPPRNRIIVGMSLGTLVIEAGERSGALISARLANEYNREVYALPGQTDNPYAKGTNALIRDGGAKLVTCLQDILDELGDVGRTMQRHAPKSDSTDDVPALPLTDSERAVLDIIAEGPTGLDDLCSRSGLSPAKISASLTQLQIKGAIAQQPGNIFVQRRRDI